jgi:cytochrome c biogenesis protein CcmG/thiol:disulfide interchange protein DsbE
MRKVLYWIPLIFAVAFIISMYVLILAKPADDIHKINKALPAIEAKSMSGKVLPRSGDYIIYFFATWCATCNEQFEQIKVLKDNGIDIYAIAMNDNLAQVNNVLGKNQGLYKGVYNDFDASLAIEFGVVGVPEVIVVKNGVMVARCNGIDNAGERMVCGVRL